MADKAKTNLPPLTREPVPYKPGTEKAQWGELKVNNSWFARQLRRFGMEW